jgi:outer membrane lipoprotein carrier protein
MRIRSTVLATALLLASHLATAGARDDLAAFTEGLKGLDGQFSQQLFDVRGKQKEASSGRVAVSAPRLFRWEYTKPYAQLVVADGKTVWVVDPDLDQATRRPQGSEEANSPLAILLEPARLDRDFTVKDGGTRDGVSWLDIAPRSADAGFKTARLGFSAGQLARLEYVDALGQRTAIAFSGWKRNPSFAAGTFAYVPGKGVDVIGN